MGADYPSAGIMPAGGTMPAARPRLLTPPALLAGFTLCTLAGCSSMQDSVMQRALDTWRTAPIEEAKAQWGPPQAVQAVPDGTAYLWVEEVPGARPPGSGPHDARAPTDPPIVIPNGHCRRRLITGPDGRVFRADWSGDACCVTTAFGYCANLPRRTASD